MGLATGVQHSNAPIGEVEQCGDEPNNRQFGVVNRRRRRRKRRVQSRHSSRTTSTTSGSSQHIAKSM